MYTTARAEALRRDDRRSWISCACRANGSKGGSSDGRARVEQEAREACTVSGRTDTKALSAERRRRHGANAALMRSDVKAGASRVQALLLGNRRRNSDATFVLMRAMPILHDC